MRNKNDERLATILLICFFTLILLLINLTLMPLTLSIKEKIEFNLSKEAIEVNKSLKLAEKEMQEMMKDGLPVTRYNDTLTLAKQIYEAQIYNEKKGIKANYSLVKEKLEELKEIKKKAYLALDELKALELRIKKIGVNDTSVLNLYQQAKDEFKSERYENCLKLIDKTYEKISEVEAFKTKLKAFYEATSRGFLNFLKKNWIILLSVILGIALIFILSYNKIMIFIIKRRIKKLERRKKAVLDLIKATQKDYFEKGILNESTYHIRVKKYNEIIRDINRQIPLLMEELEMRKRRKI